MILNQDLPVAPRSGAWIAWLGGVDDEISALSQTITLPTSGSISLRFYYQIGSEETFGCDADLGGVLVDSNVIWQIGLCQASATTDWTAVVLDLSGYAAQTVTLEFLVGTDFSLPSSLLLDDVVLQSTP